MGTSSCWLVKPSRICSEARRHNALIRSSALGEPLKPLLRPLLQVSSQPGPTTSLHPDTSHDTDGLQGMEKPGAKQDKKEKGGNVRGKHKDPSSTGTASASAATGTTSHTARQGTRGGGKDATSRLSVNTAVSVRTSVAVTAFEDSPAWESEPSGEGILVDLGIDFSGWDAVPRTVSPLFPRDVATLVGLSAEEARTLVKEYGLVTEDGGEEQDAEAGSKSENDARRGAANGRSAKGGTKGAKTAERPVSGDTSSWVNSGLEGSREDDLNRFMRHIGVSLLPSRTLYATTQLNGHIFSISPAGNGDQVGFQVLPSSAVVGVQSPMVERRVCAFDR